MKQGKKLNKMQKKKDSLWIGDNDKADKEEENENKMMMLIDKVDVGV